MVQVVLTYGPTSPRLRADLSRSELSAVELSGTPHGNTLTEVDSPFIFIDKETLSFRSEGISYIDIIQLIY